MKVYSVYKSGVYLHECAGIFSTRDAAEKAAELAMAAEHDDYHSFHLYEFELDARTPLEDGEVKDDGPICYWQRLNGIIHKIPMNKG